MKKIGLVLAGGGGKGSYQIGVWKALKEFEVDKSISAIAATSIGVLNSILILEDDLQKAEQIWKDISPSQILTLHKSVDIMKNLVSLIKSISPLSEEKISDSLKLGLFSREGLLNILHNNIDLSIVNKSTIPCYATCFNTSNNKAEYFLMNNYSTEEIHSILLATSAIPRLFQAVKIGSDLYYDGFLADNLPVKPLYDSGCDLIFVVHLGRTDVIDHSEFPGTKIVEIVPQESLGNIFDGNLDFTSNGAIRRMEQGYNQTKKILEDIYQSFTIQNEKIKRVNLLEEAMLFQGKNIDIHTVSSLPHKVLLNDAIPNTSTSHMKNLLDLIPSNNIAETEKDLISTEVKEIIGSYKRSSSALNQLAFESITALAANDARLKELSQSESFFTKILPIAKNKNLHIREQINTYTQQVQYAALQMIQELDKQSLLPLNSLISLNNRVNILESKNETLYFEICSMLGNMIEKVNRITSIDKLENDVELLQWIASIKYNSYNGIDYKQLSNVAKIVCITDDFFRLTKGEIDVSSLNLLKSTLEQLNLYPDSSISYREFFQHLINDPSLINKLFSTISTEALYTIKTYQAPLLKGIEKVKKLYTEDFYLFNKNGEELLNSIVQQYLFHEGHIVMNVEIPSYEFILELLVYLNMIKDDDYFHAPMKDDQKLEVNSSVVTDYNQDTMEKTGDRVAVESVVAKKVIDFGKASPPTAESSITNELTTNSSKTTIEVINAFMREAFEKKEKPLEQKNERNSTNKLITEKRDRPSSKVPFIPDSTRRNIETKTEEEKNFEVLILTGGERIEVIESVSKIMNVSLKEAAETLQETSPKIAVNISLKEAQSLGMTLENFGASVLIKPNTARIYTVTLPYDISPGEMGIILDEFYSVPVNKITLGSQVKKEDYFAICNTPNKILIKNKKNKVTDFFKKDIMQETSLIYPGIDGTVIKIMFEYGQKIQPGMPLLSIVEGNVMENDVFKIFTCEFPPYLSKFTSGCFDCIPTRSQ